MITTVAGSLSSAVTHLAAQGLALIAAESGCHCVRAWWEEGTPATAHASWSDERSAAGLVQEHIANHVKETSWVESRIEHLGQTTATFSPRIKAPRTAEAWDALLEHRRQQLDLPSMSRLDHLMIGALGEQAYWLCDDPKGISDQGASRWEMKTRNRGEEFVQHRLSRLSAALGSWTEGEIEAGIAGRASRDAAGGDGPNSRTPTGLTSPGPLDNALAWCALWGISSLQTVPQRGRISASAGVDPTSTLTHPRVMALPVRTSPTHPSLWRELASSDQFARCAFAGDEDASASRVWLRAHNVAAVVHFQTVVAGSSSAPERYLLPGRVDVL